MVVRERLQRARETPLIDEKIPHPYREIHAELKAIRRLLERPAEVPTPIVRVPGVPPAPAPSAYIDVIAHGLRSHGALLMAKDLYVETVTFDNARSPAQEFTKLTGIALTIFSNDGTFDLYLNEKDDSHKLTFTALTYPQTFLIDWFELKTVYIGNTAQAGKSAVLIAWKPVEAPPAIPPTKAILAITPADRETFRKMGDINRDGVIDDLDFKLLQAAYGSRPGDPNWNPDCDLDQDGVVTHNDLATFGVHYGLTIEAWKAGSG